MNRIERALLALIVAGYLGVGALFGVLTPPWQAPDEPAHYNYVAQLAGDGCCPVIQPGDWDGAYQEEIISARFPPDQLDDLPTIEYEDHQPPLYYLLLTSVFRLSDGDLIALRLTSVLFGLATVVGAYGVGRLLLPGREPVVLAAAALVAFVPQHLAILGSVNNDSLAEAIIAATLFACLLYVRGGRPPVAMRWGAVITLIAIALGIGVGGAIRPVPLMIGGLCIALALAIHLRAYDRWPLILGGLLGLALVTKATAYFLVAVVALAVILRPIVDAAGGSTLRTSRTALKLMDALSKLRPDGADVTPNPTRTRVSLIRRLRKTYAPVLARRRADIFRALLVVFGVALVFGGVWWVRNVMVYGFPDVLGLTAHDAVVVGQPRTVDRIAEVGVSQYFRDSARTTFNSYWGQFGWMAQPLPTWAYRLIGLMLAVSVGGYLLDGLYLRRADKYRLTPAGWAGVVLLALTGFLAAAAYIYYNLTFLQLQGRYLYPALIPFALLVANGLHAWVRWGARGRNLLLYITPVAMGAFGLLAIYVLIMRIVPYLSFS